MGGALVTAAAKTVAGQTIAVCDYDHSKAENFAKQYGANAVTGMEIAENADFVVLGVKPQVMGKTLAPLASALCARENLTVVTMAAGVSIAAIRGYIGKDVPVIRIMPNTPVALGAGMILYTTADVSAETEQAFLRSNMQSLRLKTKSSRQKTTDINLKSLTARLSLFLRKQTFLPSRENTLRQASL